ncbi:MAG: pentapeptide repeat-containing protein [Deltaproteobacteria bacterium]|nr:pentapeptide repeat-containing protein [Deltaproteobacteria bacterium]
MPKALPFVGSAFLVATAGVAFQRIIDGNTQQRADENTPDLLLLAGSLIGLIVLSVITRKAPPASSTPPALSPARILMASPTPGSPLRTNQQIFQSAIVRYSTTKRTTNWNFDFVDALIQEQARTRKILQDGEWKVIIDMTGIDGSNLQLKHIDFWKKGYILDFTGSNFDKLNLTECDFTRCILDGVKMRGIDFSATKFMRCQFGKRAEIKGKIWGSSRFEECLFQQGTTLDGSTFENVQFVRCRFRGVTLRSCLFDKVDFEWRPSLNEYDALQPDFNGVIFDRSEFKSGSFDLITAVETSFRGCRFDTFEFKRLRFNGVTFDSFPSTEKNWETIFDSCGLGENSRLTQCELRRVRFRNSLIIGGKHPNIFEHCDFSESRFEPGTDPVFFLLHITGSHFKKCRLNRVFIDPRYQFGDPDDVKAKVIFESSDLSESILSAIIDRQWVGATLGPELVEFRGWNLFKRAIWRFVQMADPNRVGSKIEGDFTEAYLTGGDFYMRDFGRSILDTTHLERSRCQSVRFRGCQKLKKAIVSDQTALYRAELPRDVRYSPIGKIGAKQGAVFN